jgi:hypothetical protein
VDDGHHKLVWSLRLAKQHFRHWSEHELIVARPRAHDARSRNTRERYEPFTVDCFLYVSAARFGASPVEIGSEKDL